MKKIRHFFKDFFLSHEENDHKPLLAQKTGLLFVVIASFGFLSFSYIQVSLLNGNENFLSAVLPSVLVDLANADRDDFGSVPLHTNSLLQRAAQMKADHMARNGYFAHVSPDGTTPWYWIEESGYEFITAGENLAVHFTDSTQVERAWMNSPAHRANILNHSFTEIGIATARGEYEGYETTFVVQMFGKPLSEATVAVQEDLEPIEEPEIVSETPEPIQQTFASIERSSEEVAGAVAQAPIEGGNDVAAQVPHLQEDVPEYSNFWERLIAHPLLILQAVYFALALLILVTLISMIISEARHKHPRHVAYLLFSLLVIVTLFYTFKPLIFPQTIVAYI